MCYKCGKPFQDFMQGNERTCLSIKKTICLVNGEGGKIICEYEVKK